MPPAHRRQRIDAGSPRRAGRGTDAQIVRALTGHGIVATPGFAPKLRHAGNRLSIRGTIQAPCRERPPERQGARLLFLERQLDDIGVPLGVEPMALEGFLVQHELDPDELRAAHVVPQVEIEAEFAVLENDLKTLVSS